MSNAMGLLPMEAIVGEQLFLDHSGKELKATQTDFIGYVEKIQEELITQGESFSDDDFLSIQMAAALIDALAKTQLYMPEDANLPVLESWHHAFNVFYKAPKSEEWKLQFANSAYLENFGANLSDKVWVSESELMQEAYTPETIADFTNMPWYTSKSIQMDKIPGGKSFVWYKKEFDYLDGGKIQVRVGMNTTGLSDEQKKILVHFYKLTDTLRSREYLGIAYHSDYSSNELIAWIKDRVFFILDKKDPFTLKLSWIQMLLEIANDIVKNSPFPLTVVDKEGKVKQVGPAYVAAVWHTAEEIRKPDFLDTIYTGVNGIMTKMNIEYCQQYGKYPPDTSFTVTRGQEFRGLEKESELPVLESVELIPSPHAFSHGTVRLNTLRLI